MNVVISDNREQKDFVGMSFSKFKKAHVKKEMLKCLASSKVEQTCYWAGELICAGHYIDLWEIIILFASKHIHVGNPKLPMYIAIRIRAFKELVSNHFGDELNLRNNLQLRELFAEITAILCYSKKSHAFDTVKLKKGEEFSMEVIQSMLKAPNVSYASLVFKPEDPKELFIAINELSYHLSNDSKNSYIACYWLEWLIEFGMTCKKNKQECIAERRTIAMVDEKYKKDSIWILWELMFVVAQQKKCKITVKIIESLLDIFCLKYTSGTKRKRKYILYNCISILNGPIDISLPIWNDKSQILMVSQKINVIYKEIKKNETSSDTPLLARNNLSNTLEKLEIMASHSGN